MTNDISGIAPASASQAIRGDRDDSKRQVPANGALPATKRNPLQQLYSPLPALRFEIVEASRILRMSRAQLYHRISEGAISIQKDGARTYITMGELERYVAACAERVAVRPPPTS